MSVHSFDITFKIDRKSIPTGLNELQIAHLIAKQFRSPENGRHAGPVVKFRSRTRNTSSPIWVKTFRLVADNWEDAEQLDHIEGDRWSFDLNLEGIHKSKNHTILLTEF